MGSLETKLFIEKQCALSFLISCQLNQVCTFLFCPLNGPLEHSFSNAGASVICSNSNGLYLSTNTSLVSQVLYERKL